MKPGSILILILLLFCACENKTVSPADVEARILYEQTTETIRSFIMQLHTASNPLEIDSLQKLFEKRITEINFSFPPETDLKLTEQENDSIYHLLQQFSQLKAIKLSSLDTIASAPQE